MDVQVKKAKAGSDSFGHVWDKDGAVVTMPHEEAASLLAIPDGGFTLVNDSADAAKTTVEEPAPDLAGAVDEAPKPRRGRPPKKAQAAEGDADKTVEE